MGIGQCGSDLTRGGGFPAPFRAAMDLSLPNSASGNSPCPAAPVEPRVAVDLEVCGSLGRYAEGEFARPLLEERQTSVSAGL